MSRAYLALGSNLGDRAAHLQGAVDALTTADAVDVAAVSRVYETAPVGGPPQDAYLNAVVAIDTDLDPHALSRSHSRSNAMPGVCAPSAGDHARWTSTCC